MSYKSRIFLAIILLALGIGPVIFIASNQSKVVWRCRDSWEECGNDNSFIVFPPHIIENSSVIVPPNPWVDNKYILEARAWIPNILGYMTGNITFTHQETGAFYFFEYFIGEGSTIGGGADIKTVVWTMQSGLYLISWDYIKSSDFSFAYEFSSAGIGYPNDFYVFLGFGALLPTFIFIALFIGLKGYGEYKEGSSKTKFKSANTKKDEKYLKVIPKTKVVITGEESTVFLQKGLLFANSGQYDKALQFFDKSLIIYPKSPTVLFEKASILIRLNRYSEALDCVNKILELQPNSSKAKKLKSTLTDNL